jgi:hypothetical protein
LTPTFSFTGRLGPYSTCKRGRPTTPRHARLYVPPSGFPLFPPDCATHARPLHLAALAFVSYGIVLLLVRVRVRVRVQVRAPPRHGVLACMYHPRPHEVRSTTPPHPTTGSRNARAPTSTFNLRQYLKMLPHGLVFFSSSSSAATLSISEIHVQVPSCDSNSRGVDLAPGGVCFGVRCGPGSFIPESKFCLDLAIWRRVVWHSRLKLKFKCKAPFARFFLYRCCTCRPRPIPALALSHCGLVRSGLHTTGVVPAARAPSPRWRYDTRLVIHKRPTYYSFPAHAAHH